eukprot:gene24996-30195_t
MASFGSSPGFSSFGSGGFGSGGFGSGGFGSGGFGTGGFGSGGFGSGGFRSGVTVHVSSTPVDPLIPEHKEWWKVLTGEVLADDNQYANVVAQWAPLIFERLSKQSVTDDANDSLAVSGLRAEVRKKYPLFREDFDFVNRLLTTRTGFPVPSKKFFLGPTPDDTISIVINKVAAPENKESENEQEEKKDAEDVAAKDPAAEKGARSDIETFSCFICMNLMLEPSSLPCGHSGCLPCIRKLIATGKSTCPVCRAAMPAAMVPAVNVALKSAIEALFPTEVAELRKASEKVITSSPRVVDMALTHAQLAAAFGLNSKEQREEEYRRSPSSQLVFTAAEQPTGEATRLYRHLNFPYQRLVFEGKFRHASYAPTVMAERTALYEALVASGEVGELEKHSGIPLVLFQRALRDFYASTSGEAREAAYIEFLHQRGEGPITSSGAFQLTTFPARKHLSPAQFRVLLRRSGCKFESLVIINSLGEYLSTFVDSLLKATLALKLDGQKLVSTDDVLVGLRAQRLTKRYARSFEIYGYGVSGCPRYLLSNAIHNVLRNIRANIVMEEVSLNIVHDIALSVFVDVLRIAKSTKPGSSRQADGYRSVPIDFTHVGAEFLPSAPEVSIGDDNPQSEVISARDIQGAVRLVLSGELTKHAISEGTKAVVRCQSTIGNTEGVSNPFEGHTGCFSPEIMVLLASLCRETRGCRLSAAGALYLSAVCEYVCAEVLELSGNCARDNSRLEILPRDIMLAIRNDEELHRLIPGIFRCGGRLPCIYAGSSLPMVDGLGKFNEWRMNYYSNDAQESSKVVVDPFTGKFMTVLGAGEDDIHCELASTLNVLSEESAAERRQALWHSLSESDQATLLAASVHPSEVFRCHIGQIRNEQSATTPAFDLESFYLFCLSVGIRLSPQIDFSMEAVDLIQQVSEEYLMGLGDEALLASSIYKGKAMTPPELEYVRRIRGERD